MSALPALKTQPGLANKVRSPFGQGKEVYSVIDGVGDNVINLVDQSYWTNKLKGRPHVFYRGSRPMHQSTLSMKNHENRLPFETTSAKYHGSRTDLAAPTRVQPVPSQTTSQWKMGTGDTFETTTSYNWEFKKRQGLLPSEIKRSNTVLRVKNAGGSEAKEAFRIVPVEKETSKISQYTLIHSKLGALRGPGDERERTFRQAYNPITGEHIGQAYHDQGYRRTSGNRFLRHQRQVTHDTFLG